MEIVLISVVTFLVAILTFFSGFGLGTILTPVFMIFFPVQTAIALTGIVHLFNNLFKLGLVGAKADREIILKFGLPAVVAAFVGSWILLSITDLKPIFSYKLLQRDYYVYPIKFIIALLLIIFALMDLIPRFKKLQFDRDKLVYGGILSGFFGGLSGNQGALRSAFLIKANLSKEAFVATAVVVSTLVDFTRLGVYFTNITEIDLKGNFTLILSATLSGIIGAFVGNKLLKKVTIEMIQNLVAIMIISLAILLGSGLL